MEPLVVLMMILAVLCIAGGLLDSEGVVHDDSGTGCGCLCLVAAIIIMLLMD